eukprot:750732-Hanusia_phi.AAC.1
MKDEELTNSWGCSMTERGSEEREQGPDEKRGEMERRRTEQLLARNRNIRLKGGGVQGEM